MTPAQRLILFDRPTIRGLLSATPGFYFDFTGTTTGSGIASVTSQPPSTITAVQGTGGAQPISTAGPPNRAQFDGVDDNLLSNLTPAASIIIAACFRITAGAAAQVILGGNDASSNRCLLGLSSTNTLAGGWESQGTTTITDGVAASGVDVVALMRASTTTVELWRNGLLVYSAPASGSPNLTAPLMLGALNNNGLTANPAAARLYRAFALQSFGSTSQNQPVMRELGADIVSF